MMDGSAWPERATVEETVQGCAERPLSDRAKDELRILKVRMLWAAGGLDLGFAITSDELRDYAAKIQRCLELAE